MSERRRIVTEVLDAAWNEGAIPRVYVRLPVEGLPPSVAERWNTPTGIPLDLNPKFPLDLAYTDKGIVVSLAFNHVQARCTLPWLQVLAIVKFVGGVPSAPWFPPCECLRRGAPVCLQLCAESKRPVPVDAEEVQVVPPSQRPALRLIRGGKN